MPLYTENLYRLCYSSPRSPQEAELIALSRPSGGAAARRGKSAGSARRTTADRLLTKAAKVAAGESVIECW